MEYDSTLSFTSLFAAEAFCFTLERWKRHTPCVEPNISNAPKRSGVYRGEGGTGVPRPILVYSCAPLSCVDRLARHGKKDTEGTTGNLQQPKTSYDVNRITPPRRDTRRKMNIALELPSGEWFLVHGPPSDTTAKQKCPKICGVLAACPPDVEARRAVDARVVSPPPPPCGTTISTRGKGTAPVAAVRPAEGIHHGRFAICCRMLHIFRDI